MKIHANELSRSSDYNEFSTYEDTFLIEPVFFGGIAALETLGNVSDKLNGGK